MEHYGPEMSAAQADLRLHAQQNNVEGLGQLLTNKSDNAVDVNFVYFCENTVLVDVCVYGNLECLQLLLQHKADVNFVDVGGKTGLTYAAAKNHRDIVRLLLAHGADINHRTLFGYTSLLYASMNGHVDCVRLLLEEGATVDDADEEGNTALVFACGGGHVACVLLLLKANVNLRNAQGRTALNTRSRKKNTDLLHFLLLCCGAREEKEDDEGETALVHAVITKIKEFHSNLQHVLSTAVIVDTRIARRCHGLYHEPLQRVMEYCGLELMLANDSNLDEDDPIPQLPRGHKRPGGAMHWWTTLT